MWAKDHEATTPATPEAVWDSLAALHTGSPLGPKPGSVRAVHGGADGNDHSGRAAAVGRHRGGTGRVYADQTVLGDLVLTFRYQLTPTGTGGTHVRHTLKSTVTARMRSVPSSVH